MKQTYSQAWAETVKKGQGVKYLPSASLSRTGGGDDMVLSAKVLGVGIVAVALGVGIVLEAAAGTLDRAAAVGAFFPLLT